MADNKKNHLKTKLIALKVAPSEYLLLEKASKQAGKTVSAFVRDCFAEAIGYAAVKAKIAKPTIAREPGEALRRHKTKKAVAK